MYFPSKGSPTRLRLMATPARSLELPRATPSSSANALLMWSAKALAAVSTSVWLE